MERKEVETHSMFLYELLNPDGSHYQGIKYLEIFIKDILELSDFDYKNVKVGRETFTDTSRRIDFTIENDKYYIAIEMKIDAGDQDEQLDDYFTFAKKQGKENTKVYYLTRDGKEANPKSVKNEETEYETISFQSDIIEFIEKSVEKSVSLPIVRETLIQYKNLIKKITNQTTQEITMQVEKIINTPEMAKSATMMAQNLGYVWALREVKFWRDLAIELEEYLKNKQLDRKGWQIDYDEDTFYDSKQHFIESSEEIAEIIAGYRKNKVSIGISFNKGDFSFLIDFDNNQKNLTFNVLEANKFSEIAEQLSFNRTFRNIKYRFANTELKFYGSGVDTPTYDIFDDKKLKKIVENLAEEVKSYMDKIVKVLK